MTLGFADHGDLVVGIGRFRGVISGLARAQQRQKLAIV
jgi:hypothetical protein